MPTNDEHDTKRVVRRELRGHHDKLVTAGQKAHIQCKAVAAATKVTRDWLIVSEALPGKCWTCLTEQFPLLVSLNPNPTVSDSRAFVT